MTILIGIAVLVDATLDIAQKIRARRACQIVEETVIDPENNDPKEADAEDE
jgi:hypothetical protein